MLVFMCQAQWLSRFFNCSLLCLLVLLCSSSWSQAQIVNEDTVRVRTRVVFIDTLVKDKKTGTAVTDLKREDFEVLADGKPRQLSYFSRQGDEQRRPLALVLVLDLVPLDAEKYLRRREVLASLGAALKKLAPEDEVAVLAWLGGTGDALTTLTDFTRDRLKMSDALAIVPSLTVTRPGRTSDKLNGVVRKVKLAVQERPRSQVVVASVTTSVSPIPFTDRDAITTELVKANVAFHPLVVDMEKKYLLLRPLLESSGRLAGDDIYGSARYVADQTGGDPAEVHSAKDFGAALEKIINGLAARYNLGFALDQSEQDDGRMHRLDVRIKARDSRGRERKLILKARRGYYIPKVGEAPSQ